MTRRANLKLPARFCRHALTRLDTVIDQTERERAEILTSIVRLLADGKRASGATANLNLADYRLRLLLRTRG